MPLRPFRSPRIEVPPPNAALNLAHPLARELGAAWLFNEAAANLVRDAGPFGLHGTLYNAGANLSKTPIGALNTNTASTDRIEAPHHEILARATQTQAALVRIRANNSTGPSITEKWAGGSYPSALRLDPTSKPQLMCYDQNNFPIATGPVSLADGKLHLIVGVRIAQATLAVYVDGVLVASVADTTVAGGTDNTAIFTIGNRYAVDGRPRAPIGAIRSLWQWGRALDAGEVAAFSSAPFDMFATPARLLVPVGSPGGTTAAGAGTGVASASASATLVAAGADTGVGTAGAGAQLSAAATATGGATGSALAQLRAQGAATGVAVASASTGGLSGSGTASGVAVASASAQLVAAGAATGRASASGVTMLLVAGSAFGLAAGSASAILLAAASGTGVALASAGLIPKHDAALTSAIATRARLTGAIATSPALTGTVAARPRLTGTITIRPAS